jgi:hypothetical protein
MRPKAPDRPPPFARARTAQRRASDAERRARFA